MILVTGEGRSGTTLMWEILTKLGFESYGHIELIREGATEEQLKTADVIKHGGFSDNLKKWIDQYHWKVEHMFYMANDMETCIAKRLYPNKEVASTSPWKDAPIISPKTLGLTAIEFNAKSKEDKEKAVSELYYRRLGHAEYNAIACGIPFSVVYYQRFCWDISYACSIIEPLLRLNRFTIERFREVHRAH